MTKEIRQEVKRALMAQNGILYNYNICTIAAAHGCTHSEVQNAYNYYLYSPQQAKFRAAYNVK